MTRLIVLALLALAAYIAIVKWAFRVTGEPEPITHAEGGA